eukprot:2029144-Prymnesium_polylepis.2
MRQPHIHTSPRLSGRCQHAGCRATRKGIAPCGRRSNPRPPHTNAPGRSRWCYPPGSCCARRLRRYAPPRAPRNR